MLSSSFPILKAVHNYVPQEELENVVIEGISYFEKKNYMIG